MGGKIASGGGLPHRTALGSVIINVQQTRLDSCAALRIFAKLDAVWQMVTKELGITVPLSSSTPPTRSCGDVWADLPYHPVTGEYTGGEDDSGAQERTDMTTSTLRLTL